ncbi:lamin tail domain-containing protein, partial [Planctomycetota bacterium]
FETDTKYWKVMGCNPDGTRNPDYEILVDLDNLIDMMLVIFYTGNWDEPLSGFLGNELPNNIWALGNRNGGDGFKYFTHDNENTLNDCQDYPGACDRTGPFTQAYRDFKYFNPQLLHQELMIHPEYRMRFADRTHKHFFNNGPLMDAACITRLMERVDELDLAIIAESARWGDAQRSTPYDHDSWENAVTDVLEFFPGRNDVVFEQIKDDNLYPDVGAPCFNQHGGEIPTGFELTMSASCGPNTTYTTLLPSEASCRALVPTDGSLGLDWVLPGFNDDGWLSGTTGVGYDYGSLIGLDVQAQMYNQYSSVYVRIPFNVNDLASIVSLNLGMKYEDGFAAYLNGQEVARSNAPVPLEWDSLATTNRPDSQAVNFQNFDLTDYLAALKAGTNVLAIHGLNVTLDSTDLLILPELEAGRNISGPEPDVTIYYTLDGTDPRLIGGAVAPGALIYSPSLFLNYSTHVKARVRDNISSEWCALNEAIFAVGPAADNLRITEIMYHPQDTGDPNDPNTEFIELTNIGTESINLNLVSFTDGIDFTFGYLDLAPDEYTVAVRDINAFEDKYGTGINVAGQYTGRFNNAGENIQLRDANNAIILEFDYEDDWYPITDGEGFSLNIIDACDPNLEHWDRKQYWRPSSDVNGTPGAYDSGATYNPDDVVINELLAHSHGTDPDWIELHNTTGDTINIGGWFLSDDNIDYKKYEIAPGTLIIAGGYVVFYEDTSFGDVGDAGCHTPFALSENGEPLYLSSGLGGELTGYSEEEEFGPSATGVTFGRYITSSGKIHFVAMSSPSPGGANNYPKVGPIVITEIMYHPEVISDAEYVELYNKTGSKVDLFDGEGNPWKFTDGGGIDFLFPADANIPAYSYALLVKNNVAFESEGYPAVPGGVQIFEWGGGKLDNGGEEIMIGMPGELDGGERQYISIETIEYDDESPWPIEADGDGLSLNRIDINSYGDDVANWDGDSPSPGY